MKKQIEEIDARSSTLATIIDSDKFKAAQARGEVRSSCSHREGGGSSVAAVVVYVSINVEVEVVDGEREVAHRHTQNVGRRRRRHLRGR